MKETNRMWKRGIIAAIVLLIAILVYVYRVMLWDILSVFIAVFKTL